MIEVLILAAESSRRDDLARMIRGERGMHVAGEAATFPFLRSLMDEIHLDLALIELLADSPNAGEWLTEIIERLPVVILAEEPDAGIFNSVVHAESGALLRQDTAPGKIIQAIRSVSAGLITLDSSLVPQHEAGTELAEELTPRETEVLTLLAEGLSNREIAARLDISEHTIKFHIRSILGKLGASTRTEAVTRGLRHGLIEL